MKLLLLASLVIVAIGCSSASEKSGSGPAPEVAPLRSRPTGQDPGKTSTEPQANTNEKGELVCPVMKKVIASVEDAQGFQDYEGKRYYFCCAMCPPQFKKDPAKFATK